MQESQSKGKTEQCKRTVRLTHQRNSPLIRNGKKKFILQSKMTQETTSMETAPWMTWRNQHQQPSNTHTYLFSAAATFMASIMFFTVSIICLALIVCCSNLVFTADCEIHSCEEPKPQKEKTYRNQKTTELKSQMNL